MTRTDRARDLDVLMHQYDGLHRDPRLVEELQLFAALGHRLAARDGYGGMILRSSIASPDWKVSPNAVGSVGLRREPFAL